MGKQDRERSFLFVLSHSLFVPGVSHILKYFCTVMGISQALLRPKLALDLLALDFSRSEFLLPIKRTTLSSSGKRSRTPNRLCCQRPSDELQRMTAKPEACTSEDNFSSVARRSGFLEPTSTVKKTESTALIPPCKGLGIVDFMRKKNFLITGATGFLAKVMIEKMLSIQPDVGKLFLIIRADDSTSAFKRLTNEVMNTGLFKELRELHGMEFQKFMLERLVPVVGDITQHNLGIDTDMVDILRKEVDIIITSAATTTFDERYDVALQTNTKSVHRVMEFGKCCEKVQLLMHISTAYVNGQREGRALEEPFKMGYSIAREKSESSGCLDVQDEFTLIIKTAEETKNGFTNSRMKDLGMERARQYGWQDTYAFTKAMAEMMIVNGREDLPVVIVRPSIIESTYSQPFPGWIEGHRMLDPVITLYGKGQISRFLGDPDNVLDLIPADMVVNATLAAMAKHAGKPGIGIYQVASSVANPIRVEEIFDIIFEHFKYNPFADNKGKPLRSPKKLILLNSMEDFYRQALGTASNSPTTTAGLSTSGRYMLEQLKYMAKIYEPYAFYKGRFDISNSEKLFQELSEEEQQSFGFDVKDIQWKDYIGNIHIPGLRQHVLKGRGTGKRLIKI